MNFHPSILARAAFLDKPRSLKELYRMVGLIEEKFSVAKERERVEKPFNLSSSSRVGPRNASRVAPVQSRALASASARCWICGQSGHFRRKCPQKSALSENGQMSYTTINLHWTSSTSGIISIYCQHQVLHHTRKQISLELTTPLTYNISLGWVIFGTLTVQRAKPRTCDDIMTRGSKCKTQLIIRFLTNGLAWAHPSVPCDFSHDTFLPSI